MESSSHRLQEGQKHQDDIRKQIALLQSQLVDLPNEEPRAAVKRKQPPNPSPVLAPSTPSPKRKRKLPIPDDLESRTPVVKSLDPQPPTKRPAISNSSKPPVRRDGSAEQPNIPTPSRFLERLAAMSYDDPLHASDEERGGPSRSASFTDAAPSMLHGMAKPKRNNDLTIAEDFEPGPYEHKPPLDDPKFERLEPHSGIRLSSRIISHEDIREYIRGRFFLSPSRLYSCLRLSADKQAYDVPVPGDWVTITVVAEIGEVKYTRPPVTLGPDEDGGKSFGKKSRDKKKEQGQEEEANSAKNGGKPYVNVRLVDFGAISKGSETGGTGVIRGDACLSMLLFKSDRFEWLENEDEQRGKAKKKVKVYKGGSNGAFESMHKLRQGDVIALLNPRVLKPFQRNSTAVPGNYSSTNMLAVSPESAGAILLVGRARDIGRCTARKKDGQPCGSWCDTRVTERCDWHMQRAVEHRRAGRAEFSVGTMGMSTTAAAQKGRRRPTEFDPEKQWGLVPTGSSSGEGTTYVLSGHVINSSQSDIYVGEKMGREAQARAQRKAASRDVEKALKQLTERDKDGMRSVLQAREAGAKLKEAKAKQGKQGKKEQMKEQKEELTADDGKSERSHGYSVNVIKGIGFNPAAAGGTKSIENGVMADKLEMLAKLQQAKKERGFDLKPRPGERVRSGVVVPERNEGVLVDLDDV